MQQIVAGMEVLASSVGYEAVCIDALPLALGAFTWSVLSIPSGLFELLQCFTQGIWIEGFRGFARSRRCFILLVGQVVVVVVIGVCTSMRNGRRSLCAGRRGELGCMHMIRVGFWAKLGF